MTTKTIATFRRAGKTIKIMHSDAHGCHYIKNGVITPVDTRKHLGALIAAFWGGFLREK